MKFELSSNKVLIVSQARMTSTRLPGKVMREVCNKPLLQYHLERLSWSGFPIVLATTTNHTDDPIVDLGRKWNVPTFRGSETDVLGRFYNAVKEYAPDIVVRVTSDCPLIDGYQISKAVHDYSECRDSQLYASNCIERTFPRGFDFEIFSASMLEEAYFRATSPSEREHVTPYFYQTKKERFRFMSFKNTTDDSSFRLTVDEQADFDLISQLITDWSCHLLTWDKICEVLRSNPRLKEMNQHIEQKKL